jgi:hypothetical protein
MEETFEIKPETNISKEKFEREALIMFKKFDKMMKQYTSNCKEYMSKNGLEHYQNEAGFLMLKTQNRNALNRELIPDIEQYYEEKQVSILNKNAFLNKK